MAELAGGPWLGPVRAGRSIPAPSPTRTPGHGPPLRRGPVYRVRAAHDVPAGARRPRRGDLRGDARRGPGRHMDPAGMALPLQGGLLDGRPCAQPALPCPRGSADPAGSVGRARPDVAQHRRDVRQALAVVPRPHLRRPLRALRRPHLAGRGSRRVPGGGGRRRAGPARGVRHHHRSPGRQRRGLRARHAGPLGSDAGHAGLVRGAHGPPLGRRPGQADGTGRAGSLGVAPADPLRPGSHARHPVPADRPALVRGAALRVPASGRRAAARGGRSAVLEPRRRERRGDARRAGPAGGCGARTGPPARTGGGP